MTDFKQWFPKDLIKGYLEKISLEVIPKGGSGLERVGSSLAANGRYPTQATEAREGPGCESSGDRTGMWLDLLHAWNPGDCPHLSPVPILPVVSASASSVSVSGYKT